MAGQPLELADPGDGVGFVPLTIVVRWMSWWSFDAALIVTIVVGLPWAFVAFAAGAAAYLAARQRRS